jgi:hypothetical protein
MPDTWGLINQKLKLVITLPEILFVILKITIVT